jgi:hypothetical protein
LSRRLEALRLVLFTLQKLEEHGKTSSRLLDDLRILRGFFLQARVKLEEEKSKWTQVSRSRRNLQGTPYGVSFIVRINRYLNTKQALSRFATEGLFCFAQGREQP